MEYKKCFKCGIVKSINEFYRHKEMKDGYLNKCKECTKKDSKSNLKTSSKHPESYDKTEKGVIRVMYKTQKRNSKLRGHACPEYTKQEFAQWLYKNGFKKLYDNWEKSGYKKSLKPSVDRIDDFKGYSFQNIRLVTDKENREHQYIDIMNGTGTSGKRCKPVLCFDSNFKLVAEYVSLSSASRAAGYSVESRIRTGRKCKRGFYWRYKILKGKI